MAERKDIAVASGGTSRDPFSLFRQMTAELDRVFEQPFGAVFHWPLSRGAAAAASWAPRIDVFERENRLITKVDLPGLKKEDVKVEVADGYLAISGERKSETEETKNNVYRSERAYGSFYRAVPLPESATLEDVKATFTDGVLEVSVPLPAKAQAKPRTVPIEDAAKPVKPAAA